MKWFQNLKIFNKLLALILINVVFFTGLGLSSYYFMQGMISNSDDMYENKLLPIQWLNEARAHNRAGEALMLKLLHEKDPAVQQQLIDQIDQRAGKVDELLTKYEQTKLLDIEKQKLALLKDTLTNFRADKSQAIQLATSAQFEKGLKLYNASAEKLLNESNQILDELANLNSDNASKLQKQTSSAAVKAVTTMIAIVFGAIALSIVIGIYISRLLNRPILNLLDNMQKAADGDLTVHSTYTSKDELGSLTHSFNEMISSLKELITQINHNAVDLAANSEQISASSEEIAAGSQEQAASANSVSEMMNEVSNAVNEVASNATGVTEESDKAVQVAEQGETVINVTLAGMSEISHKISSLSKQSDTIGEIIVMIDDIAEQTNLLAVNAAIEAARAGDAGKGFAVVADEVRKLAERSSVATKEISELIRDIQVNVKETVEAVAVGNENTNSAGEQFQEIKVLIKNAAVGINEIAAASEQLASQSTEVLTAVENIASVTEETSSGIQQTADSATNLSRMAEELNQLAAKFTLN
ncbi:methyl-accepting chemotaxis protein [Bacillus tianshenii]|nr:methyl-accepting chemotaxis protein [Bacillus tianshenii]